MKHDQVTSLKQELGKFIAENRDREVYDFLKESLINKSLQESFILICNRFNQLAQDVFQGVVKREDEMVERSKINKSLLGIIQRLEKNDLNTLNFFPTGITNSILILGKNNERIIAIQEMLNRVKLVNVKAKNLLEASSSSETDIDIIIFDNTALPFLPKEAGQEEIAQKLPIIQERERIMQSFLSDNSALLICHLGGFSNFVNQNKNRVYAANSQISLCFRVLEMADFINRIMI